MPKFTLVLDSSQISTYLDCPQLWYYQYVLRLVPLAYTRSTEAMNSGTYGHKLLDIYYKLRCDGLPLTEAASQAFTYNPDSDTCECGCLEELHVTIPLTTIRECQKCKKCLSFRPKKFDLDPASKLTVQNRLREYFFKYQNNDFQPLSKDHIEVGFSEPIHEDTRNLFILEGRIDMLATLQGLQCCVDHKFQVYKTDLYPKSIQFKNYALVSKNLLFIINYIRLAKAFKDGETLIREPISFTVQELQAWKKELIKIFFRIKEDTLNKSYNQQWNNCMDRYRHTCNYTHLCEEPDKEMKLRKQNALYKINDVIWKPW